MEFIICHKDMSTNDAIMHASLQPGEWQNHLYKAKEIINGKVRYIYDTAKAGAKAAVRAGVNAYGQHYANKMQNAFRDMHSNTVSGPQSKYLIKNKAGFNAAQANANAAASHVKRARDISNYLDNGGSYKKVVGAAAKVAGKYALSKGKYALSKGKSLANKGKSLANKGMTLLKNKIKQYNSTKNRSKSSIYSDAAGPSAPTRWQKEAMQIKKDASKIKSGLSKVAGMQSKFNDPKNSARQKTKNSSSKFLKKLKDITAAGNARHERYNRYKRHNR